MGRVGADGDDDGVRLLWAGCAPTLPVQDNEIAKVTSPHDDPVTHGNLCIKGRFGKGRFGCQHVQNHAQNRD